MQVLEKGKFHFDGVFPAAGCGYIVPSGRTPDTPGGVAECVGKLDVHFHVTEWCTIRPIRENRREIESFHV